jgi:hypothetical protein
LWGAVGLHAQVGKVDFSRQIRPLLARRCLGCHGPDEKKREADLRLDTKDGLLHPDVIAAGKPEASELFARLISTDKDEVMPPPGKGDPMTAAEIELVKTWIAQGAEFQEHWSFKAPTLPAVPQVKDTTLPVRTPIDAFVFDSLAKKNLQPAEEATREAWLRRVTLDLTGLPPTLADQEAFLNDTTAEAYETVVKRLLASPAYGERMANEWLDVARYADTYGRHEDADCITWPYRDWVIRAFNENLPYDQFVTWQTAGDLLPNPTQDQMIATCFNRLPQQSNEAGSDPEEFRIEQVADRIRTNGIAFLGLAVECARCHDHKYDPISMRDYYSLASFFNNIDELGLFAVYTGAVPPPSILIYPPELEAESRSLKKRIADLEQKQKAMLPEARARFTEWLKQEYPPRKQEVGFFGKIAGIFSSPPPSAPETRPSVFFQFDSITDEKKLVNSVNGKEDGTVRLKTKVTRKNEGRVGSAIIFKGDNAATMDTIGEVKRCDPFSFGMWLKPHEEMKRAVVASRSRSGIDSASRGMELVLEHMRPQFALVHFSPGNEIRIAARRAIPVNEWTHITVTYDGSSRAEGMTMYVNGVREDTEIIRNHLYKDIVYREEWGDEATKDGVILHFAVGGRFNDASFRNGLIDELFFYHCELTAQEAAQRALLPDESEAEDWFAWYLREKDQPWRDLLSELHAARAQENEMTPQATELMVMREWAGKKRPTHILNRGQFNQPKEEVTPDTPASLPPFPKDQPRNRLGFAKWLTDRNHPLTSRVQVNRLWQQFFGRGLVKTAEDFGTQGQLPSHPELLDWLAVHFMDIGWDTKALCREIVLSSTYRQSSLPRDAKVLADDPENRLLARGPRGRMTAEQVRDMALAVSGLLKPKIGGPSVRPYQPAGLWEESGTQHSYTQDHGDALYRRSMYTFWRRTLPPPSMTVFDAPTREFCKVRRDSTATPLQALVLMNDPQFIETARILAERLVKAHPQSPDERVSETFRLFASKKPEAEQTRTLADYLKQEQARFTAAPEEAKKLLTTTGESPVDAALPAPEVAATTMMVRMMLCFSETTMKP